MLISFEIMCLLDMTSLLFHGKLTLLCLSPRFEHVLFWMGPWLRLGMASFLFRRWH